MAEATIKQVKDFFEEKNVRKFTEEWKVLSDESKTQIRTGIGNGTFTY